MCLTTRSQLAMVDKKEMYDTMRKLLANATPEKKELLMHAAPLTLQRLKKAGGTPYVCSVVAYNALWSMLIVDALADS